MPPSGSEVRRLLFEDELYTPRNVRKLRILLLGRIYRLVPSCLLLSVYAQGCNLAHPLGLEIVKCYIRLVVTAVFRNKRLFIVQFQVFDVLKTRQSTVFQDVRRYWGINIIRV